jgi:hypothetical protein
MSSTAMRIKNNSDVQKVTAKINILIEYGSTEIEKGQWGSIDCEYVWYTLNCYNENNVLMYGKTSCYGNSSFELTGEEGDYLISELK